MENANVSIREEQLKYLDSLVEQGEYANRSAAVRGQIETARDVDELRRQIEDLEDALTRARQLYLQELRINDELRDRADSDVSS